LTAVKSDLISFPFCSVSGFLQVGSFRLKTEIGTSRGGTQFDELARCGRQREIPVSSRRKGKGELSWEILEGALGRVDPPLGLLLPIERRL